MARLSGNRYSILGYVVWRLGRRYLRRRLPRKRTVALAGAGALGALTAAAVLAKRLSG